MRDWKGCETIHCNLMPLLIFSKDNPLHISMFPPYQDSIVNFSFYLNACLDIFEIRQKKTSVGQDLGLLHAIDERLAAYGWLTTTGVKFLIVVDTIGQPTHVGAESLGIGAMATLRESDLKPACFYHFSLQRSRGLQGSRKH